MSKGAGMTPLQRYIAEEIAVDHADGLLTRREAMRRLGLLGLSVAAASTVLAACSSNDSGCKRDDHRRGDRHRVRRRGTTRHGRRRRDGGDHVLRSQRHAAGRLGRGGGPTRRGARHPRESRPHRPHSFRGGSSGGSRILGSGDRPAVRGGRHRDLHRLGAGDRGAGPGPAGSLRCRHEGRHRRIAAPRARSEDRPDRLLHGWRADLADAQPRTNPGSPPRRRSTARCRRTRTSPGRTPRCWASTPRSTTA